MKNGLLTYKLKGVEKFNIGDYIQSLAASQFFNDNIDVFINRGEIGTYSGDKIRLICNGWFKYDMETWPPTDDITPLFISFHINSVAKKDLLNKKSIEYFKKRQPIGCRDKETYKLLKENGVDSYFSGCLTTTLGIKYKSTKRSNIVYFVDPHIRYNKDVFSILIYLWVLIRNVGIVNNICKSLFKNTNFKSLIKTAAFFKDYKKVFDPSLLKEAIYINHMNKNADFKSEEEKFNHAKKLIEKYAEAKLVVTSRIHCALPCLGLETSVIYIENTNQKETSYCRLDGLRDMLNIISYDKKGTMKVLFTEQKKKIGNNYNFKNKTSYVGFKDQMKYKCYDFVKNVK